MNQGFDSPVRIARDVVIGANSKVWRAAAADSQVAARFRHALSHRDVRSFEFSVDDRVWVFAYSRRHEENARLLKHLSDAGVREIVYVSTATTNVSKITNCYEYPRVKLLAELQVRALPNGRVLTLGLVFDLPSELPTGLNAATSQKSINQFLIDPVWSDDDGKVRRLFEPVAREFSGVFERTAYAAYSSLQSLLGSWPCILRPVDLILRVLGYRWYGYVNLSNKLWYSTK